MTQNPDHTRRWLINASGAALLSNVLPAAPASAQGEGAAKPAAAEAAEGGGKAEPLSPVTVANGPAAGMPAAQSAVSVPWPKVSIAESGVFNL